jgi:hypothetical protein
MDDNALLFPSRDTPKAAALEMKSDSALLLSRPVFFVGMPRSGSTLVFDIVTRNPSLAWPSLYVNAMPALPRVELLRNAFDNRAWSMRGQQRQRTRWIPGNRLLPQPSEAYPFWNRHAGESFARGYLEDQVATTSTSDTVRRAVLQIVQSQRRARFAAKLTGPPRVAFLRSIFPDAVFVHLVRDGRAVVQSLLGVDFWRRNGGMEGPYWHGAPVESFIDEWEASGRDPGVLAGLQWRTVVRRFRDESVQLGPTDFVEVRYEDFVADPLSQIRKIESVVKLPESSEISEYLETHSPRRGMNDKFRQAFTAHYLAALSRHMEPELSAYAYG